MLSIASYSPEYVDGVRGGIARQLSTYRALKLAGPAVVAFEREFFRNLILALDAYFGHRARAQELKDGNPLNEVRSLCGSLMAGETFTPDKTVKYDPARAVLKLKPGDEIVLDADAFEALADGFFTEIEKKYAGA
jgi:hypothetical protein